MFLGIALRASLRVVSFFAVLTVAMAALAAQPVKLVRTVAATQPEFQPTPPAPYDADGSNQESGPIDTDLNNRPTIQIDGKSCCPCCPPGTRPSGTSGYGSQSYGGQGATPGESLTLAPQQYAALDPTVSAVGFGGGGYLDLPFIVNQFRIRYDDAYDNNAPDRAEYFYAKCGCFGPPAVGPTNSRGQAASFVNYQAVRTYLELRASRRFSAFVELPVQFDNIHFAPNNAPLNNAGPNLQTGGFADMNAGFKYALLNRNGRYLTFQLRTYIPTGNPHLGLGTAHVSLEPSLLYWRTLTDRAFIQGQFTDWTPLGGSTSANSNGGQFAGNILEYGGAFGYVVYRRFDPTARSTSYAANLPPQVAPQNYFLVTPLLEGIGWTALGGQELFDGTVQKSAAGITVFNLKLGVRFTKGLNSIYTGWAHGMTHDVWYRNMFRLEYRRFF